MNSKINQDNNIISSEEENNLNYINHLSIEQDELKNTIKESEMISNKENEEEKEINNNIDINNKDNIDEEENEDFKITKNNNNNSINNNENNNNNNNHNNINNITINNLLFQLKQMSDKQLYLLDLISNLQKNSSEQINNLNKRIRDLEGKLKEQNNDYYPGDTVDNINSSWEEDPNYTLTKILNGKNNEKLIKYLNGLKLEEIKKLDIKLIEDTLIRLCILLTEGFKVHEIISFIKGLLIINKIKLKEITKKNLKDVFNYVQQNLTDLKEEDSVDISLIVSYLNI